MSQLETRHPDADAPSRTNRLAVWALVLSVLSLGGIGSLIGIVLGVRARRQVEETGEKGSGLAAAAVVIGVITLLLAIGYWVYVSGGTGGGSSGGSTGGGGNTGYPNGG